MSIMNEERAMRDEGVIMYNDCILAFRALHCMGGCLCEHQRLPSIMELRDMNNFSFPSCR
jgi:hypothetical protein